MVPWMPSHRLLVLLVLLVPCLHAVLGLGVTGSLARVERSVAAGHKTAVLEATGSVLSRASTTTELPVPLGDAQASGDDERPPGRSVVPFVDNQYSDLEIRKMKEAFFTAQREGFAGINVTVFGAHGLTDSGSGWVDSSPDPYVNVSLVNKSQTQYTTETKYDTSSPIWDESYTVTDFADGDTFEFTLMDRNHVADDTLIGRGYVSSNWFFPVGFEGLVYLDDAGSRSARLHISLAELTGKALSDQPTAQEVATADQSGENIRGMAGEPHSESPRTPCIAMSVLALLILPTANSLAEVVSR